jgi:hypothetical protein
VEGERKGHGEAGKVQHLDDKKSRRVEWVLLLESGHADGGPSADDNDGDGESDAEPAEPAMQVDVAGADQYGLHNEEHNPCGEHNGVDVQDKGRERRAMYEVMVDCVAEAVHRSRGDQQRHEEIKVLTPKAATLGLHLIRQRVQSRAHFRRR